MGGPAPRPGTTGKARRSRARPPQGQRKRKAAPNRPAAGPELIFCDDKRISEWPPLLVPFLFPAAFSPPAFPALASRVCRCSVPAPVLVPFLLSCSPASSSVVKVGRVDLSRLGRGSRLKGTVVLVTSGASHVLFKLFLGGGVWEDLSAGCFWCQPSSPTLPPGVLPLSLRTNVDAPVLLLLLIVAVELST
eukprot:4905196-Amphidinium_carterae.1